MYIILTAESEYETHGFADLGEGPFDNAQQALCFAHCEVGVPWLIVHNETKAPCAYGDAVNILWSCVPLPTCPGCGKQRCELGGARFWCKECGMEFGNGRS